MGKTPLESRNIIACFYGGGRAGDGGSFDSRTRPPSAAEAASKTGRYRSAEALRHPKSRATPSSSAGCEAARIFKAKSRPVTHRIEWPYARGLERPPRPRV